MYLILWLLAVKCLTSSAQLTIANNGRNVLLHGQHVKLAETTIQFPSNQQEIFQSNPLTVASDKVLLDGQLNDFPQGKNGMNIEAQQYSSPVTVEFKYHNYDTMTKLLRQITARYPSLTALYSIGKSVQGKHLYFFLPLGFDILWLNNCFCFVCYFLLENFVRMFHSFSQKKTFFYELTLK